MERLQQGRMRIRRLETFLSAPSTLLIALLGISKPALSGLLRLAGHLVLFPHSTPQVYHRIAIVNCQHYPHSLQVKHYQGFTYSGKTLMTLLPSLL